jgi:hypothetical protein
MTCLRVRDALAAGLPLELLLDHVDACFDCQFYLENRVHVRDLKLEIPDRTAADLVRDPEGLSCGDYLRRAAEEGFAGASVADPHAVRCTPCRRTAEAFEGYRRVAAAVTMPPRLRRRLEAIAEERGVSVLGRILPYVAAVLFSLGLSLFLAAKGNLSQEVVRLQEKAVQTRGAAVSTCGKVVGFIVRSFDKEDPRHEMRQSP